MNHRQMIKIMKNRSSFLVHDAACYWSGIYDAGSESAIYFRDCYEEKKPSLPNELQSLDGEDVCSYKDDYKRIRQLIYLHGLDKGDQISREALLHIATVLKEEPPFLFYSASLTKESAVPDGLDQSVSGRLDALHIAAAHWKGIKPDSDHIPANKEIAKIIENSVKVSSTMANHMASIVRPDWAKDKSKNK